MKLCSDQAQFGDCALHLVDGAFTLPRINASKADKLLRILPDDTSYFIAENDFMVSGGDGYPNFFSRATTRDIMDQAVADYITANSPIWPAPSA
jgi:hypothetical protein